MPPGGGAPVHTLECIERLNTFVLMVGVVMIMMSACGVMNPGVDQLEQALGYHFRDRTLLRRALTHSSSVNEAGEADAPADNERLEFLGDSVLGLIVSEWVFERFHGFEEGQLSLVKNHVVSARHLLDAAQRIELGRYLHLGRGEETAGGRGNQRLLANAFEAVIAAVYLDGGAAAARELVFQHVIPSDAEAEAIAGAGPPHDYRAELERLARERDLPKPAYSLVSESGPPHARVFAVAVRLGKGISVTAEGSSKKAAARGAAKRVCEALRESEKPAGRAAGGLSFSSASDRDIG